MSTPAALIESGQFVSIEREALGAGDRAAAVPDDTRATPLMVRVSGFLVEAARIGDEVSVTTRSGRIETGVLRDPAPRHGHDFGRLDPLLLRIAPDVTQWLARKESAR